MERMERRGSIARAFGRIRTAMKRRRPTSTRDVRTDELVNGISHGPQHFTSEHIPIEQPATVTSTSGSVSNMSSKPVMDQLLVADTDGDNDFEEVLLPVAQYRPGISTNKARDLFSRYGLLYARERTSHEEARPKLRRVERPIRMRLHWTCHACRTEFGLERMCVECGHQKCTQCPRDPPKRVKEVLENGRHIMHQIEQSTQGVQSTGNESRKTSRNNTPFHSAMLSTSSERSSSIDADSEVGHLAFDYTSSARPAGAVRMSEQDYHRARCSQHLQSLGTSKWIHGSTMVHTMSNGEIPVMKAAVRRVYRKPRQRVRYTCEHCSALLVEGTRCRECDSDVFTRNPYVTR